MIGWLYLWGRSRKLNRQQRQLEEQAERQRLRAPEPDIKIPEYRDRISSLFDAKLLIWSVAILIAPLIFLGPTAWLIALGVACVAVPMLLD